MNNDRHSMATHTKTGNSPNDPEKCFLSFLSFYLYSPIFTIYSPVSILTLGGQTACWPLLF